MALVLSLHLMCIYIYEQLYEELLWVYCFFKSDQQANQQLLKSGKVWNLDMDEHEKQK